MIISNFLISKLKVIWAPTFPITRICCLLWYQYLDILLELGDWKCAMVYLLRQQMAYLFSVVAWWVIRCGTLACVWYCVCVLIIEIWEILLDLILTLLAQSGNNCAHIMTAYLWCVKLQPDLIITFKVRSTTIFGLWALKPFVKWTPNPLLVVTCVHTNNMSEALDTRHSQCILSALNGQHSE